MLKLAGLPLWVSRSLNELKSMHLPSLASRLDIFMSFAYNARAVSQSVTTISWWVTRRVKCWCAVRSLLCCSVRMVLHGLNAFCRFFRLMTTCVFASRVSTSKSASRCSDSATHPKSLPRTRCYSDLCSCPAHSPVDVRAVSQVRAIVCITDL